MLALLAATAIPTAIPTTIGVAEGINAQKRENNEKKRTAYCSLSVYCSAKSRKRQQINGKGIVLRDAKLFIGTQPASTAATAETGPEGHPFNGFYITYPNDEKPLAMVSMSSNNPPAMGFIFADKDTYEMKYGNRSTSLPHIVGPWDWTDDEVGVTLEGKEGFVAVEEQEDEWAIYFDRDDNWKKLPKGKRTLEISLERVIRDVATDAGQK